MSGVIVSKPEDVRAFGRNDAAFIGQLEYWLTKANAGKNRCVVNRRGVRWVVKSRSEWCDETLLTAQQLRNVLERLESRGVIKRERHLFDNKTLAHICIDTGILEAIRAQSGAGPTNSTGKGQDTQTGEGPETQTSYIETGLETKRDYGPASRPGIVSGPGSAKINGKEKSMSPGSSVNEILAGRMRTEPVPVSPENALKPGELAQVFQTAWSDTFPGTYLPPLIAKHYGQLKQIAKACPRGAGGKVIDYCVRHWQDFVATAVAQQGAWKTPQLPDLGFMLSYVQSAVQSWQEGGLQLQGGPAKGAKPKKVPKTPEKFDETAVSFDETHEPGEEKAGLDEVAKLLGLGE